MATVSLSLRASAPNGDEVYEDIDLTALTPRARALAEALAQSSLGKRVRVLMQHADTGELLGWSGWSHYPHDSTMPAITYLERESRKIAPGWHVYGTSVDRPIPSLAEAAQDQYLTRATAMKALDLTPDEWDALRRAKHLPEPDRYIEGQPEWTPQTIEAYRTRPVEAWPLSRVAEWLGYTGPSATSTARRQLGRWSVPKLGRLPGRGGETLYAEDQVKAIKGSQPGSGRREAPREEGGKFTGA